MRLHALIPTIPGDLVAALDASGIKTDVDLLFSGTPLDVLQRLPPGVVSLADLTSYIALVAERASAPGVRGDVLYAEQAQRRHAHDVRLTCGVDDLDALVDGFGGGRVFEISGDRGSGKTSLVMQIALRLLAAHADASVLWMDTLGDFSAQRTSRVAAQLLGESTSSSVLERLRVSHALNIETTHVLLEDVESSLTASVSPSPRVRLVIIDSITSLLAPSLSAVSSHGHAVMTTFMQHLRTLARSHYLAFLIVNNTSASHPHNPMSTLSAMRKPALGPSFTFLTDCTVWLAKQESTEADTSIHVAEILRSRTTPSRRSCTFKIQNGILRSVTQG